MGLRSITAPSVLVRALECNGFVELWPRPMLLAVMTMMLHASSPACSGEEACRSRCSDDSPSACYELAKLLRDNAATRAEAQKLLERGCAKSHWRSCGELAFLFVRSTDKADHRKALPLYQRACDNSDAMSCAELGRVLWEGVITKPNVVQAAVAAKRGCDLGFGDGCAIIGALIRATLADPSLSKGSLPKKPEDAVSYFEKACALNSSMGCTYLGIHLVEGTGVDANTRRAFRLFEQACADNYASGCFQLAFSLERGQGARRDRKRARTLYEKSCEMGVENACKAIGREYPEPEEP